MRKLPMILALAAAIGGLSSLILVLISMSTRDPAPLYILPLTMILTFGPLSTARRLARQNRA